MDFQQTRKSGNLWKLRFYTVCIKFSWRDGGGWFGAVPKLTSIADRLSEAGNRISTEIKLVAEERARFDGLFVGGAEMPNGINQCVKYGMLPEVDLGFLGRFTFQPAMMGSDVFWTLSDHRHSYLFTLNLASPHLFCVNPKTNRLTFCERISLKINWISATVALMTTSSTSGCCWFLIMRLLMMIHQNCC